jgi:hypothetical protein
MPLHDQAETLSLRNTVMAALSMRQRHTAHPADRRMLDHEASAIALAIQEKFAIFERREAEPGVQIPGTLLPAKS